MPQERRKEAEDVDYIPEKEEVYPIIKRSRNSEKAPTKARTAPRPTSVAPAQDQLTDMSDKLKMMEEQVRALTEELKNQKVKHLRDVNLLNMRIDRLNADLERERTRNSEAMGKLVSTMADEIVSNVSRTDMEALIENFLMKRGLIPDGGCRDDELRKRKDDDQNDDPDAAEGGNQA